MWVADSQNTSTEMSRNLAKKLGRLLQHIDVEPVSTSVFTGRSADLGWGRVYGGQSMAQALAACQKVAGPLRTLHHFDCHFLKGGDVSLDMRIEAETIACGRSFTTGLL